VDIEAALLAEHSKRQALRIAVWIGNDKERLDQLVQLLLKGEYVVAQRAAWVLSSCAENHPQMMKPYLKQLVAKAADPRVHDAVKRNVVRLLQHIQIPRSLLGSVATLCFDFLSSPQAPIAVKAFSMTVLANIAEQEPDIGQELRLVITQLQPHGSPGIQAHARKVLKRIGEGRR
jgi:hypothetical protein